MKKRFTAFLLLALTFTLTSCAEANPPKDNSNPVVSATEETMPQSKETLQAEIILLEGTTAIVADINEENYLYSVPIDVPLYNGEKLSEGNIIEIGFDGSVLESYPAKISPEYFKIVSSDTSVLSLYKKVFYDLYQTDAGLNEGIEMIAMDLTDVKNLKSYQKNALFYVVSTYTQLPVYEKTYDQLVEEGYIDKENLFFEKGILVALSTSDISDTSFQFDISKWRSGLGAYYFTDCAAEKKDGLWRYTIGAEMIS